MKLYVLSPFLHNLFPALLSFYLFNYKVTLFSSNCFRLTESGFCTLPSIIRRGIWSYSHLSCNRGSISINLLCINFPFVWNPWNQSTILPWSNLYNVYFLILTLLQQPLTTLIFLDKPSSTNDLEQWISPSICYIFIHNWTIRIIKLLKMVSPYLIIISTYTTGNRKNNSPLIIFPHNNTLIGGVVNHTILSSYYFTAFTYINLEDSLPFNNSTKSRCWCIIFYSFFLRT